MQDPFGDRELRAERRSAGPAAARARPELERERAVGPATIDLTPPGSAAPFATARACAEAVSAGGKSSPIVTGTVLRTHRRGRCERSGCGSGFEHAARRRDEVGVRLLWRSTSTGRSRRTMTRSVFGKARSYVKLRTLETPASLAATVPRPIPRRLRPKLAGQRCTRLRPRLGVAAAHVDRPHREHGRLSRSEIGEPCEEGDREAGSSERPDGR